MTKKSKSNTSFKERAGPFGVGKTVEDIKKLNIYEELIDDTTFAELTKNLDEKGREHVLKEAKIHAASYQKILDMVAETLSTPEGKKKFKEMARKKARGK